LWWCWIGFVVVWVFLDYLRLSALPACVVDIQKLSGDWNNFSRCPCEHTLSAGVLLVLYLSKNAYRVPTIRGNEPRRNAMNSPELRPLHIKALCQMNHGRLTSTVRTLLLRHVDQQRRHRSSEDHAASISALTLEDVARSSCQKCRTVKTDAYHSVPVFIGIR